MQHTHVLTRQQCVYVLVTRRITVCVGSYVHYNDYTCVFNLEFSTSRDSDSELILTFPLLMLLLPHFSHMVFTSLFLFFTATYWVFFHYWTGIYTLKSQAHLQEKNREQEVNRGRGWHHCTGKHYTYKRRLICLKNIAVWWLMKG